jgi:creatinine amidohydrolase/Fe(II)-dependent formamide hydrolase-like protein
VQVTLCRAQVSVTGDLPTEARRAAGISSSNHDDMRAGELETSVLLAAHSSYVRDG